CQQHDKSPPTF
nr:immunoglobulin light chain junction region [Macaca mulatta]MOW41163.1 immunoglobulin light chain junction region [Macaca mulatta]MOW41308.1 immunoglobulin light chain junction region [Macaca mulatta]MOW41529.1 immunoglobulin light chain junction region [Macaca mulatta]MOW41804.1 immunoglobulin light chain junction region [Macaca mulatta]